jgi:Tol biopolymer transport system component
VLDLKTNYVSTLPNSRGLFSPLWSPDGRYIVAIPADSMSVVLFDFQRRKWSQLAKVRAAFLNWSRDGRYVYFLRWLDDPAVLRVRIADRKVEKVSDLTTFRLRETSAPGWASVRMIPRLYSMILEPRMCTPSTGKSLEVSCVPTRSLFQPQVLDTPASSAKEQKQDNDQKHDADTAAAVVANARTHVVATATEHE